MVEKGQRRVADGVDEEAVVGEMDAVGDVAALDVGPERGAVLVVEPLEERLV